MSPNRILRYGWTIALAVAVFAMIAVINSGVAAGRRSSDRPVCVEGGARYSEGAVVRHEDTVWTCRNGGWTRH